MGMATGSPLSSVTTTKDIGYLILRIVLLALRSHRCAQNPFNPLVGLTVSVSVIALVWTCSAILIDDVAVGSSPGLCR